MLKRIYKENEVNFALIWIVIYVVIMNIALNYCGGFDNLASKTIDQLLVPVICILLIAIMLTIWIVKNKLSKKYGICKVNGKLKNFLWFIPLIIMSCINMKNGLELPAPIIISLLMMLNMMIAGYVEEIIFRGFLFKGMAKDNLKVAILVSSLTFGVGHIVNIFNTSDILGVLLQVCYATSIGFLYTIIFYKSGSLWPNIISHAFVNGTSVFASEYGPFSSLINLIFGSTSQSLVEIISALIIIIISSSYALWLYKKNVV